MTESQAATWSRIAAFPLDSPGVAAPYSARLRKENQWTSGYTERVIEEYRRFAFLTVAAGHMVSPSDAVDQAWHLHLFYTDGYWNDFCRNALGRPLHHHPSQGGGAERTKFGDAYGATLASYRRLFGEDPPSDIWPTPESKARERHDYARVDQCANWVVPKIRFRSAAPWIAISLLGSALGGCAAEAGATYPFNLDGPGFLGFYVVALVGALTVALAVRQFARFPASLDRGDAPDVTPLEAACLAGDVKGSLHATIASLALCGYLKIHPVLRSVEATNSDTSGLDPLAAHIVQSCAQTDGCPLSRLETSADASLQAIHGRLVQRGLMLPSGARLSAGILAAVIAWAPLLVGLPRLYFGVMADHPVGFLFGLCLITFADGAVLIALRPRRTLRGDAVLSIQRRSRAALRNISSRPTPTLPEAVMAFALFGPMIMPSELCNEYRQLVSPVTSSTIGSCSSCGGSSCGGGCGGGGCGGGCGG